MHRQTSSDAYLILLAAIVIELTSDETGVFFPAESDTMNPSDG